MKLTFVIVFRHIPRGGKRNRVGTGCDGVKMPKTSSPMTRISGKTPPAPNSGKLQSGSPMVRDSRQPSPWSGYSFNAEKAVAAPPLCEDEKRPPDNGEEDIAVAKPVRPLTSAPIDSWPILSRSGDEPDDPKKKGKTIDYPEKD